jgi:lysozyme
MMKKLLFILALWFLVDWAYNAKAKKVVTELIEKINGPGKEPADTTAKDSTAGKVSSKRSTRDTIITADSFIYGIDISHWQKNELMDITKIKNNDSLHFVICKATDGKRNLDKTFKKNWDLLNTHKMIKGAYHFFRCRDDAGVQAKFFIETVNTILQTDLPPIIDFETSANDNNNCNKNIGDSILAFLRILENHYKRKPIIYANRNDANTHLKDPQFSSYPLWIAAPVDILEPQELPGLWNGKWVFWQKSWSYVLDNRNNDLDKFNGDSLSLIKFIEQSHIR